MLFQVAFTWSSAICFLSVVGFVTALSNSIQINATTALSSSSRCYKSIFSFGDSLADTGTYYYAIPQTPSVCLYPPYGETYFHYPTGRWSDGRLVVDFLALHLGLPLLKPYMGIKNGQIRNWNNETKEGVNFAVGGATALDVSFWEEKGIYGIPTNYSLRVQLDWFKELLPSICNSSSGCKQVLGSSLFLVGEIGGNDFNYLFFRNKNVEEIRTYVPQVINAISSAIRELIDLGAQTLVVPGNLPIGCNIVYLRIYQSTDMEEYDQAGCLKWLNKFVKYYNEQLYAELNQLQMLHPQTNIIYADYYHASLSLHHYPKQFGFSETVLFNACCDGCLDHRYGSPGVMACDDPSQYISWDGIHLTEAAYKWIATGLIGGQYTNPKIGISCVSQI